LRKSEDVKII